MMDSYWKDVYQYQSFTENKAVINVINSTIVLLDISADIKYIKKSIRYEMQHLMQIGELSLNRNIIVSLKMDSVILSVTATCC